MERRKPAPKGGDKPKRRAPTDQASTALGAVPEKRGLKLDPKRIKAAPEGSGQREMRVNVKTAKKRKLSSTLWLDRQLNDDPTRTFLTRFPTAATTPENSWPWTTG